MNVRVPPACAVALGALLSLCTVPVPVLAQDDPPPGAVEQPPAEPEPGEGEGDPLERAHFLSLLANGPSHASGNRPDLGPVVLGNPTRAVVTIRVGLSWSWTDAGAYSEFIGRHHRLVQVSPTVGTVHVRDGGSPGQIAAVEPGMVVEVSPDGPAFAVKLDGVPLGSFAGPVRFLPTEPDEQLRVQSIRRSFGGTQVPRYRGVLEVARGSGTPADRVNLVNVIEVESYVPGVVANESIASFHMEALRAQAVAARGYAIANIGRFAASFPYDIVDSAASQVYRGVISEHPRAVQAAAETLGLVASHQGRIISALYSSSMGGHTENNEWIFNSPSSSLPGANAQPYLRGIYDGTGPAPDFGDPAALAAFWGAQQPQTFDSCGQVNNRFSRWRFVMTAAVLKSRLIPSRVVVTSGNLTGTVTDVQVTKRMASGRAAVVKVTSTTGTAEVRGWDNLRNVFRTVAGTPLDCGSNAAPGFVLNNPSVLEQVKNADGSLREVRVAGGGWGHNVGMSQFGAHGRGRAGQSFLEILNAYYTGADIGTYPIDIGREPGSGPPTLRQSFYAPAAEGRLEIRAEGMKGLRVHVNELYDLSFGEEELAAGLVSVDLGPYVVPGLNTVQYNPVGRGGTATVTVVVD